MPNPLDPILIPKYKNQLAIPPVYEPIVEKDPSACKFKNGQPPFDHPTKVLPVEPFLLNGPINPPANENGWKDTIQAYPGQVTTIRVCFAPQDVEVPTPGVNLFPFIPANRPGYAWHCHILDHEDNEMMRPYKVAQSGG